MTNTNNYIKMTARHGEEFLFFFFDQHIEEGVLAALAAAREAQANHDGQVPVRGVKGTGPGKAHLSVWKKCRLLQSLPEVGEFVEIVPVPHADALVS